MMIPQLLAAIALSLSVTAFPFHPLPREGSDHVLGPETYDYVRILMNGTDIPGSLVVITSPKGDEIISFGVKDKAGNPITEDTYFPIASNSKLITAVAINILAEQNITLENGEIFSTNSKMMDVIPGFQMYNQNSTPEATVLDFLSHQTGLPAYALTPASWLTPQGWSDHLRNWTTNLGLRESFQYSNMNYAVLSHVVEQLSKKDFYETVQEIIFDPLHLEATYDALETKDKGRSQGFLKQGINSTACALNLVVAANSTGGNTTSYTLSASCKGQTEAFDFWTAGDGKEWTGGGAALMRGKDMLAWAKELLNPQVISPNVVSAVQTGVVFEAESGDPLFGNLTYAQGCLQQTYRGYDIVYHDPALPGYLSFFVRVPNETVGVFVVTNDDVYGTIFNDIITWTLLDDLLGLEPIDWFARRVFGVDLPTQDTSSSNSTTSEGEATGVSSVPVPPADPRSAPEGYVDHTFRSAGWTDFTLKPLYLNDSASIEEAALPLDYLLHDLIDQVGPISAAGPLYYGYWEQSVGDRILFSHFDGPLFNMTALKVYERVKGDFEIQQVPVNGSQYIAKVYGAAPAVFAENGIGLFGNFWGSGASYVPVDVSETNVEEQAIVFFARL